MTLGSSFFLPFTPFLRADLSDWIEALLSLTWRNLTEVNWQAQSKAWKYSFLTETVPVFFNSDMKELPCCYLLSFPKSASESHTKVCLTFVPARPERVKTGNQQHLFGALYIPLLIQGRGQGRDRQSRGSEGAADVIHGWRSFPGGLTSGAMRR